MTECSLLNWSLGSSFAAEMEMILQVPSDADIRLQSVKTLLIIKQRLLLQLEEI